MHLHRYHNHNSDPFMHSKIATKDIYFLANESTGIQHTDLNTSYIEYLLRKKIGSHLKKLICNHIELWVTQK